VGWTLLRTRAEWDLFRATVAARAGCYATALAWGEGPAEYPCLVASVVQDDQATVRTAYVYAESARQLLAADTREPARSAGVGPWQADFNRWTTAHLLTIVHFLVETGICSKKVNPETNKRQYEDLLLQSLDDVDRWSADAPVVKRLGDDAASVLSQLGPVR
jgi:hypothetical protein